METEHHVPEATAAITAELVACTLGQRQRTELRVDTVGKVLHAARRMAEVLGGMWARSGR